MTIDWYSPLPSTTPANANELPDAEFFGDEDAAPASERMRETLRHSYTRNAETAAQAHVDALLQGTHLAETLPPLDYLVPNLGLVAGSGAPHLVAGVGFSGKTLALQSMLLSLAAGRLVWGGYTAQARRVVHVDLEQGRRLTQRRYQRLARSMGVDLAELGDALAVSVMPRLSLTEQHRAAWKALMVGRDVMLIDSLRAATGGLDENSSEIREALDMLGSLSEETECRVIVIHHARKPTEGAPGGQFSIRGSSAIFDACDGVFIFSAEKGEPVRVENVKAREHGELVDDIALTISDVADDDDEKAGLRVQVHGAELVRDRKEAKARAAQVTAVTKDAETISVIVGANPGITATELRDVAGMSGARITAAKLSLGGAIETRNVKVERGWLARHYLCPVVAK